MIDLEVSGRLATLTLDRPPANAWSAADVELLAHTTRELARSSDVRAVIVRARGRFFSAGGDIRAMVDALDSPSPASTLDRFAIAIQSAFNDVAALPMPTVAVIEGIATGGGLELALACDLRIASREARLGLSESRIGLIPAGGGTQRLTRLVGRGRALRLMLLAELIDADTAWSFGLVDWVEDPADVEARVEAVVESLGQASALAQVEVKACVDAPSLHAGLERERESQQRLHRTGDTIERLRAFVGQKKEL